MSAIDLIFLDVDGVLNSKRTHLAFGMPVPSYSIGRLDLVALALLRNFCHTTGAKIVLSSSWRIGMDYNGYAEAWKLPIVDRTKVYIDGIDEASRGQEIQEWISRHVVYKNSYVVIDDDNDGMGLHEGRFIRTDYRKGFGLEEFEQLCSMSGINPFDCLPGK